MCGCCKMVWDHRWPLRPVKNLNPPSALGVLNLDLKSFTMFLHIAVEWWNFNISVLKNDYYFWRFHVESILFYQCVAGDIGQCCWYGTWGFPNLNVWLRNNISQENIEKSNRPVKCSFSTLTFLGIQSHTDFCCCAWVSFWTISIVRWRINCALCVGMELEDNLSDWRVCQKANKKLTSFSLAICMIPTGRRGPSTTVVFNLRRVVGTWHPSTGILSETRCWHRLVFYLRDALLAPAFLFLASFHILRTKMRKASTIRTKVFFGKKNAQYVKSLTLWGFFLKSPYLDIML